ncbi:phage major capsid protein [Terrihabitans sp. B22-R8]|uniref:phage major capsid protein n=1 Tax=Terrihabitans sp. B22-R8 TaxID=3425128 RepID=UPI00403CE0EF
MSNLSCSARPVSRAILAVHANAENSPAYILAKLNAAWSEFKERHENDATKTQAAVDKLMADVAALKVGGGASTSIASMAAIDPEYNRIYASWMRDGMDEHAVKLANAKGERAAIQASMMTNPASAGGYLAPMEWDRMVLKALESLSPMRRIADVQTTSTRGYTTVWNNGGWGSGWIGETAARPETTSPNLSSIEFAHGEVYANPAVTQLLLDDADFNLENWIADEIGGEFTKQESLAFLVGNGVNKPQGLLTYTDTANPIHPGGALAVVPSGKADSLGDADTLVDFVYGLPAPYRQNARWLVNSMTAATVMKFKSGDGDYLWRETLVAGQPATLLGYPVEIDENMPSVVAGALPIAFGDFSRGYVINDRLGTSILRDPYTNKPFVNFYARKRVGGGVRDPKAVRLLRIAAA